MFTRFDERTHARVRRPWVAALSVAAHAGLAWLGTVATLRAKDVAPPDPPIPLVYLPPGPVPPPASGPQTTGGRPTARGAAVRPRTVPPPGVIVPGLAVIDVPDPSVGGPPLDASSLLGSEAPGGGSDPYHGADDAANGGAGNGGAWAGAAVEVEARLLDGSVAPRYPAALERSGVAGRVLARFVVDARGRVEPRTVVIVATDHELFTAAVRRALAAYRFAPARVGGRAVRQLVEMPFVFEVRR